MFNSEKDQLLIRKKADEVLLYTQHVPIAIKMIEVVILPTLGSDLEIKWWKLVQKEIETRV